MTVTNKQNSAQNKTKFASNSITTTANVSCYKIIPFPTRVISKVPKPQLFGVIKLSTVVFWPEWHLHYDSRRIKMRKLTHAFCSIHLPKSRNCFIDSGEGENLE